jgi:hypothetical protein
LCLPLAMIHRLVGDCCAPETMALLQRPLPATSAAHPSAPLYIIPRTAPHFPHESATDTTELRLPFIKAKLTNLPIAIVCCLDSQSQKSDYLPIRRQI